MSVTRDHIRRRLSLLNSRIDAVSWDSVLGRISKWAERRESRYVCLCNVHSLVTGYGNEALRQAIEGADTAAPDGVSVARLMRHRGAVGQERIDGASLMWRYAEQAALDGTPVFLYGATSGIIDKLMCNLRLAFPALRIAGYRSPPFHALAPIEEDETVDSIVRSGAAVVFVGLACPQQEIWMANIAGRIPAVLIGVGAAFDFHAGLRRPPAWMQRLRLEWLFALNAEPRRYCVTNTLFFYYLLRDRLLRSPRTPSLQ